MLDQKPQKWRSNFANNLKIIENTATVEQAVAQLVKKKQNIIQQLSPPVDLSMMASICGITPLIQEVEMNQDARLVPFEKGFVIQVNNKHNRGRKRFSSAHEIGHKILQKAKIQNVFDCYDIGYSEKRFHKHIDNLEEEKLCDLAARHLLLLTSEYLTPYRLQNGFSLDTIHNVQSEFDVSFEAAARAITETSIAHAAILFLVLDLKKEQKERENQLVLFPDYVSPPKPLLRLKRKYTSNRFPVNLPTNKSVPENSCITRAFNNQRYFEDTEILSFDNKKQYEFHVETISREIYVGGFLKPGVIALLSNPKKIE